MNLFWVTCSHLLDVHATLGGAHQTDPLADAVGDGRHIEFLLDVSALFDEQAAHLLTSGASLVCDQLHAKDGVCVGADLIERLGQLDAATIATATRVDLRLNNPDGATKRFGGL